MLVGKILSLDVFSVFCGCVRMWMCCFCLCCFLLCCFLFLSWLGVLFSVADFLVFACVVFGVLCFVAQYDDLSERESMGLGTNL